MTPVLFVALAVAGGVGAAARLALDGAIRSRLRVPFPVGTAVINVSGSLVLGILVGLVAAHALPSAVEVVAGTGFLGGYTTFSTASFETVRLAQERRVGAALLNGLGVAVLGTGAAALGLLIGALV